MKIKEKEPTWLKKKLAPEEQKIRRKYRTKLFICLIYAAIIQLYFISLNINNILVSNQIFNIYVKISAMLFILIAILMFEVAYKKEKKTFIVNGIEFILLSIHTLLVGRTVALFNKNQELHILSTSYVWPIYYCLKAIIIHTQENRRRLKQISDISEIVKEEKPVKKVAKKRKK